MPYIPHLCRKSLGHKSVHQTIPISTSLPNTRLTIISSPFTDNRSKRYDIYYECKCDCGAVKVIAAGSLTTQRTVSCGCRQREVQLESAQRLADHHRLVYGSHKHPLYVTYSQMMRRCHNIQCPTYRYYGARGITVCDEWRGNPAEFLRWADNQNRPSGSTLHRIKGHLDYSPDNCKFIPATRNSAQTRANRMITINGVIKNLSDWCREYDRNLHSVSNRISRLEWEPERAILTPTHNGFIRRTPRISTASARNLLYNVWKEMISRYHNPRNKSYHNYGDRGITVCNTWRDDFGEFLEWALQNGWKRGLILDREDNNGNYEPSNCNFVTRQKSARNTRSNV